MLDQIEESTYIETIVGADDTYNYDENYRSIYDNGMTAETEFSGDVLARTNSQYDNRYSMSRGDEDYGLEKAPDNYTTCNDSEDDEVYTVANLPSSTSPPIENDTYGL